MTDATVPAGKWEFDAGVTGVFDDMLARSIPAYATMRDLCSRIGRRAVRRDSVVVDLGCSRGGAIAPLVESAGQDARMRARYLGLEASPSMATASRERFAGQIAEGWVEIRNHDLRVDPFPVVTACLIFSVLTIQFTPIEHRLRILRDVHRCLQDGGIFIFVEKVIGASAGLDELMVECYYDLKRENGYTEEQIQRKRLSLEGVLVPMTAAWNEEMLRLTGFREIDCFWRWMNFAGWAAVK